MRGSVVGKVLRRFSLTTVLIASALATAVVFAAVIGMGSIAAVRNLVVTTTLERHEELARQAAAEYDQVLVLHRQAMQTIAQLAALAQRLDMATLHPMLQQTNRQYPALWGIGVTDATGRLVAADPPTTSDGRSPVGVDLSDRAWFRHMRETLAPVIDRDVVVGRVKFTPTITVNVPILDDEGQLRGAVTGGLNLADVQAMVSRFRLGATGRASVATAAGRIFAHGDPEAINRHVTELQLWAELQRPSGRILSYRNFDGRERLAGFATVPSTGWKVWIGQDVEEIETAIQTAYRGVLGWLALTVAGLVVTAVVLALAITRPVKALEATAAAIAGGNLQQEAPEGGTTEVAALARSFNRMAASLRDVLAAERDAKRRAERALVEYGALAARIADGDLATRATPVEDPELGALGQNLNRMAEALERHVASLREASTREAAARAEVAIAREQAARRAAESDNAAKDNFLAVLSHELRTPLNAILGWARMLRGGTLDPETARRALETIERNARSQANLIEDLLDVSRIVTGNLSLEPVPLDLPPVIEAAVHATQSLADTRRVRLTVTLDLAVGAVRGDPARLQQVVWNLLSNAIKFTPSGGEVEVALTATDGWAEIRVSDTGMGIAPDFLPHIFERFRQADPTSTRVHGGLGLGLAIVRHLVELHHGTVEADSAGEGRGATFRVRLPLLPPGDGDAAWGFVHSTAEAGEITSLDGVDVVFVDDDADARELIEMILSGAGAKVRVAASAREAVRLVDNRRPDLLVTDLAMPSEDGVWLIRALRARPGPRMRIPALALSAHARPEDRRYALEAGFDAHLAKPVSPAELTRVAADLLAAARQSTTPAP